MSSLPADNWDAVTREMLWRESVDKSRQAMVKLEGSPSSGFYVLCLAELDAVSSFDAPECFSSRAALIEELRRLIAAPTNPSRPVPSVQAYRDSQKWFLEHEIKQYEADA